MFVRTFPHLATHLTLHIIPIAIIRVQVDFAYGVRFAHKFINYKWRLSAPRPPKVFVDYQSEELRFETKKTLDKSNIAVHYYTIITSILWRPKHE